MKCDMAIQTEVSLQNIRYVADLGLIWKKSDLCFSDGHKKIR